MIKKILLILLVLSFVIEAALTFLCFFDTGKALQLFGMTYSNDTAFLAYIIAWFCFFITALIVYLFVGVQKNETYTKGLIYLLALWWVGLGIGVYIVFGKTDNLLLDSVKGLLLIIFNYLNTKNSQKN